MERAKELIFGAAMHAVAGPVPATSSHSTSFDELLRSLASKFPGIEKELSGLTGSDAEKREQVCFDLHSTHFVSVV